MSYAAKQHPDRFEGSANRLQKAVQERWVCCEDIRSEVQYHTDQDRSQQGAALVGCFTNLGYGKSSRVTRVHHVLFPGSVPRMSFPARS